MATKTSVTTTVELYESRALTAADLVVFSESVPGALLSSVLVTVEQGDSQRDGQWFKITGRWSA